MKKIELSLAFLFLLTSFICKSQPYLNLGAGIIIVKPTSKENGYAMPAMNISGGYQFSNNIIAEGLIAPSILRKTNAPSYFGAKLGFNINGIIPSIGYAYNYKNSDNTSGNGWGMLYSLKYQRQINDNGGIFLEGTYTGNIVASVGFHIEF